MGCPQPARRDRRIDDRPGNMESTGCGQPVAPDPGPVGLPPASTLRLPRPGAGSIMCGIAAALDLSGTRASPADRLLAMTGAITHRGPDDESTHREPGLALGARRLSIVDLEGGRQPLANEDGSVWVAFNGELFEYPELSRDLRARGHL